jgi:CubicO group peptidase (beta-lactamase class C family)
MKRCVNLLALFGLVLFPVAAPAETPFDPAAVDAVVRASMKTWQVPGAGLAIVRDGELRYLHGYGVRSLDSPQPVTPDTLFPIASCTKAFTATAIAVLVDEGKMGWDDPVRKHVPFFRLADPLASDGVTIRDLLCHRTGLSRHDWLWVRTPWDRETLLRKIGHVPLARPFRSEYQYQNIMYVAAGYAAGRAAKSSWEDLVRQRLFEPLGMRTANFSTRDLQQSTDFARPHVRDPKGKVKGVPIENIDAVAPAGGINASARELVAWLHFQLGDGTFGGRRLVAQKNLDETHRPQTVIRLEGAEKTLHPETLQKSYGLGWVVQDYRGRLMLSHTGGLDGYRCRVALLPREKLGLVLLTNSSAGTSGASMHTAATNALVDLLLGAPRRDWDALYADHARQVEERDRAKDQERRARRKPDTKPSHPLADYAGGYEEPAYGRAEISVKNDKLFLKWSGFRVELEHWHFDTFRVKAADDDLDGEEVLFRLAGDGSVAGLRFLETEFRRAK